jgi:hypothetical protein
MKEKVRIAIVPEEVIMEKIYVIREQKVMLDMDLAVLYGVETKALKRAVRRNLDRFPPDFMFELTDNELEILRSQFVTSRFEGHGGLRYPPFCFTEQGVTMLSCILNSPRAIEANIRIIRVFTRLREALFTHKDILLKLDQLENEVNKNREDVRQIFTVLRQLLHQRSEPREEIGYKRPAR